MVISPNRYEIDATQAIDTLNRLQSQFRSYNQSVGDVSRTSASFTASGKNNVVTMTQIDAAGRRITTTLREVGNGYKVMGVNVGTATAAQTRAAAEMERQRALADRLAASLRGGATGNVTPTTVTPNLAGSIGGYRQLSEAQLRAAATAQGLNAAQTQALLGIPARLATVRAAFEQVTSAARSFRDKLDDAGRVAFNTAIYRGISLITQGLSEGTKNAIAYSKQIGLVQTLAGKSGETFNEWSAALRKVADNQGVDVVRVAKDAYDGLSNQVIKTTKDLDLLNVSLSLEKNTGSAPGTGLRTLSALINGLGLQTKDAAQLADELFRTVDLGDVKLGQLNDTIGKSAGLLRLLGASRSEYFGALAILTQGGSDAAESATLLNNVFTQLLKPNKELSAELRNLGFASGDTAVKALGLFNLIGKLQQAAKETPEGLATFFPDIRGLRGVSGLIGDLNKVQAAQQAIANSKGANADASKITNENPGQKLEQQVQRLKNIFTVDFGQKTLELIVKITSSFGNVDEVIKGTIKTVGLFSAVAGGAFVVSKVVTWTTAITKAVIEFNALTKAFGIAESASAAFGVTTIGMLTKIGLLLAVAVAGYMAAAAAARAFSNAQERAFKDRTDSFRENRDEAIAAARATAQASIAQFSAASEASTRKYLQFISEARRANDSLASSARKTADAISKALSGSFDSLLGIARQNFAKFEGQTQKAFDNIEKAKEQAKQVVEDAEQSLFENRRDEIRQRADQFNKPGKVPDTRFYEEEARLVAERNLQLRQKIDLRLGTGDLDEANALFKDILANINSLKSASNGVVFRGLERGEREETQRYLALLAQAGQRQGQIYQQRAADLEKEKQKLTELEDVLKTISTFTKDAFNKDNTLKPEFEKPGAALEELTKLQAQARTLIDSLPQSTNETLNARFKTVTQQVERQLVEQMNAVSNLTNTSLIEGQLKKATDARTELYNKEREAIKGLTNAQAEANVFLQRNLELAKSGLAEISRVGGQKTQTADPLQFINPFVAYSGKDNRKTINESSEDVLSQLIRGGVPTEEKATEMLATIARLKAALEPIKGNKLIDATDTANLTTFENQLETVRLAIVNLRSSASTPLELGRQIEQAKAQFQQYAIESQRETSAAMDNLARAQREIGTEGVGSIQALTKAYQGLKIEAEQAAAAAKRVQDSIDASGIKSSTTSEPSTRAGGGMADLRFLTSFFGGKFAKGTDVIPTMLSKGEFVVRAPMAEKYYSQLVAMNSNRYPLYRAAGGSVSTTNNSPTFNITVGGGGKVQAKQIVQAIRRAQTQGTIR